MLKPVGTIYKEHYKISNSNDPLQTETIITLEVIEHKMIFGQMVQIVTEIDREWT